MIINHQREKTFQAITYFLNHTSLCNKKKLYKLLYLLDFEHFEQTGRNVTGFDYYAWKMGPVPTQLHEMIDNEEDSLLDRFEVEKTLDKRERMTISFKCKTEFNPKIFTRRELRILESLATRFDMMNGDEMEAFTHQEGMPWHRVWYVEGNRQKQIPYSYSLDRLSEEDRENILDLASEREAFINNYR